MRKRILPVLLLLVAVVLAFAACGEGGTSKPTLPTTQSPITTPVTTIPAPTESSQTTPAPTESSQTTPAPTESSQTTPAPTESSQTTPAPTQSSQTTPAPTQSTQTTPAPTQSTQTTPAPTQSTQTTPAPTQSTVTTTAPTQPVQTTAPTEPPVTEPPATKPPVTSEPLLPPDPECEHEWDFEKGKIMESATCLSDGTILVSCTECEGEWLTIDHGSREEHTFADGFCTECGRPEDESFFLNMLNDALSFETLTMTLKDVSVKIPEGNFGFEMKLAELVLFLDTDEESGESKLVGYGYGSLVTKGEGSPDAAISLRAYIADGVLYAVATHEHELHDTYHFRLSLSSLIETETGMPAELVKALLAWLNDDLLETVRTVIASDTNAVYVNAAIADLVQTFFTLTPEENGAVVLTFSAEKLLELTDRLYRFTLSDLLGETGMTALENLPQLTLGQMLAAAEAHGVLADAVVDMLNRLVQTMYGEEASFGAWLAGMMGSEGPIDVKAMLQDEGFLNTTVLDILTLIANSMPNGESSENELGGEKAPTEKNETPENTENPEPAITPEMVLAQYLGAIEQYASVRPMDLLLMYLFPEQYFEGGDPDALYAELCEMITGALSGVKLELRLNADGTLADGSLKVSLDGIASAEIEISSSLPEELYDYAAIKTEVQESLTNDPLSPENNFKTNEENATIVKDENGWYVVDDDSYVGYGELEADGYDAAYRKWVEQYICIYTYDLNRIVGMGVSKDCGDWLQIQLLLYGTREESQSYGYAYFDENMNELYTRLDPSWSASSQGMTSLALLYNPTTGEVIFVTRYDQYGDTAHKLTMDEDQSVAAEGCTGVGYYYFACSECDKVYKAYYSNGHEWTDETATLVEGAKSCEDGVILTSHCKNCSAVNSYVMTDEHPTEYFDGTVGCPQHGEHRIRYETCPCGKVGYFDVDGESYFSEDTAICPELGIRVEVTERPMGGNACEQMSEITAELYCNGKLLATSSHFRGTADHEYVTEYEFLQDENCENGVRLYRYCTRCGEASEPETVYDHRTIDMDVRLKCKDGEHWVEIRKCACGKELSVKTDLPMISDEPSANGQSMLQGCELCGCYLKTEISFEQNGCTRTRIETYTLTEGDETLLVETRTTLEECHSLDMIGHVELMDGSQSCEDGVWVYWQCSGCGMMSDAMPSWGHIEAERKLDFVCCESGGEVYEMRCACGERYSIVHYDTALSGATVFYNENGEEVSEGDPDVVRVVREMTCDSGCGYREVYEKILVTGETGMVWQESVAYYHGDELLGTAAYPAE